jgi:trypsin-like peptidase
VLRKNLAVVTIALLCSVVAAQVAPPKYGRYANNLQKRYEDLRCAMVTITWEEQTQTSPANGQTPQVVTITHFGTGFYASATGDIITAAHVVGNKSWSDSGTGMIVSLATPEFWTIGNSKNETISIVHSKLEQSPDSWGADLAKIMTGYKPPCWLKIADGVSIRPGDHVITLGFPQLAFRSLSLYSGIISARLKSDLLIGTTAQGAPVKAQNEFLRVQMPISVGLSGSAVIDDNNRAVAVVSAAGASTTILDALIQVANTQDVTPIPPGHPRNLEWPEAVGNLARTIRDYASPGYGDSVPLSYLKKAKTPTSANLAIEPRGHQR